MQTNLNANPKSCGAKANAADEKFSRKLPDRTWYISHRHTGKAMFTRKRQWEDAMAAGRRDAVSQRAKTGTEDPCSRGTLLNGLSCFPQAAATLVCIDNGAKREKLVTRRSDERGRGLERERERTEGHTGFVVGSCFRIMRNFRRFRSRVGLVCRSTNPHLERLFKRPCFVSERSRGASRKSYTLPLSSLTPFVTRRRVYVRIVKLSGR